MEATRAGRKQPAVSGRRQGPGIARGWGMEEGKHLMPAAAAACIPATASSITTHCMAILTTERSNNRATPGAPSHSAAMA